jgi:hypothetical protein
MSVYAEMHDGTRLEFPDGTDPAVIQATVKKRLGAAPDSGPSVTDRILDNAPGLAGMSLRQNFNAGAGVLRGVKDVIDTGAHGLATLYDKATGADAPTVGGLVTGQPQGEAARIRALDKAGADAYNARFGSAPEAQIGRLGGQALATYPIGGALGQGARLVGAPAKLVSALSTAGATTGRSAAELAALEAAPLGARLTAGAGDLALRSGAGAAVGGASVAAIDPEHTGTGAIVGAALPPALKVAGPIGTTLAKGWQALMNPRAVNAAEDLAAALGASTPEQRAVLIQQLKSAPELITTPTVAQALQTPEAGILQRVVHDVPGGKALRDKIAAQGAARSAALESVAPTAPNGLATAQEDLGRRMTSTLVPERAAAKADVSNRFESIDPFNEVKIEAPVDALQAARDKFLPKGTFGSGKDADAAIRAAKSISPEIELPAVKATRGSDVSLLDAVKKAGGITESEVSGGLGGEVNGLRQAGLGRVVYKNRGLSLDAMAEKMHESGFLPSQDPAALLDLLYANPKKVFAGDAATSFQAAADHAAGGVPGAEKIVQPASFQEVQALRSSIGEKAREAARFGKDREAAALFKMRDEIDAKVKSVAEGGGKAGENFPPDQVATWRDALDAHAAMKQRFDGGLGGMFRKGQDGEPALQGAALARKTWGDASNVQAFKKLVGDHEDLLGDFKSMVTTEGAQTGDQAGNLTIKFARWVDKRLPALKEAFSPEEVDKLQKIAADIERHASSVNAGATLRGSDTVQKAANALSLGVLDNPGLRAAAGHVPFGKMAVDFVRGAAKDSKAERLAELLADAPTAANALAQIPANGLMLDRFGRAVVPSIYRGAPRSSRDR